MKKKIILGIGFVILAVSIGWLVSSFTPLPQGHDGFMHYIHDVDNGLVVSKEYDDLVMEARYRPLEEIALSSLSGLATQGSLSDQISELKGSVYFNLRLRSQKTSELLTLELPDGNEYYRRLHYYTSGVDQDLALIVGADTVPCAMAHFQRSYGAAPFNDIVISFVLDESISTTESMTLIYRDRVFGKGDVEFNFNKTDLNKIPELKLS